MERDGGGWSGRERDAGGRLCVAMCMYVYGYASGAVSLSSGAYIQPVEKGKVGARPLARISL